MRNNKREHGAITVFLSFAMASIIAFMGMLTDVARLRVSESQVKRAAQLALDATMTQYSRRLREDYGLFGYAGGQDVGELYEQYYLANLQPDAQKPQGDFYQLLNQFTGGKIKYGDLLRLKVDEGQYSGNGTDALSSPDVLYRQIVEFSKFRVPLTLALDGKLSELNDIRNAVNDNKSNMESANETMKLGKPMEKFSEDQKALEAAVQDLNAAIEATNEAIDTWNDLIYGRLNSPQWQAQSNVQYYPYHWKTYGNGEMGEYSIWYIESQYYDSSVTMNYTLTFGPMNLYDVQSAAEAFADQRNNALNRMRDGAFKDFERFLERQQRTIDQLKQYAQEIWTYYDYAEEDDPDKYDYLDRYNELIAEINALQDNHNTAANAGRSDSNRFIDAYKGDVQQAYNNLVIFIATVIQDRTNQLRDNRNAGRELVGEMLKKVKDDIETLDRQKEAVNNAIADVTETLDRRAEAGKCSDEIRESWKNGRDGDADEAEKQLEKNDELIAKLRPRLEELEQWCAEYDLDSQRIDREQPAQTAVNAAEDGSVGDWAPSSYALDHVHPDETEYDPFPDKDQYEEKRRQAQEKADEKKAEANRIKEADAQAETTRYNPESMDKYRNLFVTTKVSAEDSAVREPGEPDKDTKADEVSVSSQQMSNLIGDIAGKIGDTLLNTIGAVYASEYILRMFSNAAPAQEDNHYPSNEADFKYAHVTTLRNQRPVGLPEYQSWSESDAEGYITPRLGFFYNAEVEYILFGKTHEKSNVTSTKIMLEAMLVIANYLQVRNDTTLKEIAMAAAEAGLFIGIPTVVTKFVVFMGFAFAETALDMHYLMRGYSIPAFSVKADKLFITHLGDANSILAPTYSSDYMLNYEFYLRLRLMLAMLFSRDDVMRRTANLIQVNIRCAAEQLGDGAYPGDDSFDIRRAYTTFSVRGGAKMPWWFMTQAIMGNNRSKDGYALIPEYGIVSSY